MTADGCKISVNGQGHLPCSKHRAVAVMKLEAPAALRELLMSVCPPGPSLHPRAGLDPMRSRDAWNGWNKAYLVGIDADGAPFGADVSAYASGHHSMSLGKLGEIPHGSVKDEEAESRTGVRFPVQVFPPLPVVLHPEHTP
jgi:hypothetical protein